MYFFFHPESDVSLFSDLTLQTAASHRLVTTAQAFKHHEQDLAKVES